MHVKHAILDTLMCIRTVCNSGTTNDDEKRSMVTFDHVTNTSEDNVKIAQDKTEAQAETETSTKTQLSYEYIPSTELFVARRGGWLEARYHFRFDKWRPNESKFPKKYQFGCLYVMNDDIIERDSGFGPHPHSNVDIFTYVINGYLTHEDNQGNSETLGRGCIQYMSVGKTIWHSEMNRNDNEKCRIIQTWIKPDTIDDTNKNENLFDINDDNDNNDDKEKDKKEEGTQYGSRSFELSERHNKLLQIIATNNGNNMSDMSDDDKDDKMIHLRQDVNCYVSQLDKDKTVDFKLNVQRQIYLVCIEGKIIININGGIITLDTRDSLRLYGDDIKKNVVIKAIGENNAIDEEMSLIKMPSAHFIIVEMKQTNKRDQIQKEFRPNDPYWTDSSDDDP